MDEFLGRQFAVMRSAIADFRAGRLQLNDLVQRIEGISNVVQSDAWKERTYPIVLALEQVNAFALDEKRSLTADEASDVAATLSELEGQMQAFAST